jgi:hypothetical protein
VPVFSPIKGFLSPIKVFDRYYRILYTYGLDSCKISKMDSFYSYFFLFELLRSTGPMLNINSESILPFFILELRGNYSLRANTARGLDFGHMIRREHIREI